MFEPIPKSGRTLVLTATRHSRDPTTLHSEFPLVYHFVCTSAYHSYRHRRIHEAQQDGQPPLSTHEEELENEENEFGSPDEDLSPHDTSIPTSMMNMTTMTSMPTTMATTMSMPPMHTMVAPNMIAPQLLQQHI